MPSRSIQRVPFVPETEFPISRLKTTHRMDQHTVAELLPPGFSRYVRVFHPFFPASTADTDQAASGETRTWQSLAEDAGLVFHAEIVWESLLPALPMVANQEEVRAWWVSEGRLEEPALSALFELLAGHSSERQACFLYYLARIVIGREPLLFHADIRAIREVQAAAEADLGPGLRPPTIEAASHGMTVGTRHVYHPAGEFDEAFESDSRWAQELTPGKQVALLAHPHERRVFFELGPVER